MALPYTTNITVDSQTYVLIKDGTTANPVFLETKAGHIEYAIAPTGTPPTADLDGHHLPKDNSQEINLGAGESLFVKATGADARCAFTGG